MIDILKRILCVLDMNMKRAREMPYEILRQGLIWGRWKSGERLIPDHLKKELDCTSSVLREALIRLSGEGLIISEKNRGFRAVSHSQEAFRSAAHLRLILEREASRLALVKGDFEWELSLSAAYQKLAHVETQMCRTKDVEKYAPHWSKLDWEFHSTLMSACNSNILMRSYKSAFDTFRMYSVAAFPDFGFGWEVTMREHKAIYEAAIERNIENCVIAIETHVTMYQDDNRSDQPLPTKGELSLPLKIVSDFKN